MFQGISGKILEEIPEGIWKGIAKRISRETSLGIPKGISEEPWWDSRENSSFDQERNT